MFLIVVGLILWIVAHFFKRIMPAQRATAGNAAKGAVTFAIFVGVLFMILGYRGVETIHVWSPPSFMVHINNTLMLLALWTFGSSAAKGAKAWPATRLRHPQLAGFSIWAVAHLLVNGDLASIVLFGGLLIWAQVTIRLINAAEPEWSAPEPAGTKTLVRLSVITLVLFVIITAVHIALGVWPFPS